MLCHVCRCGWKRFERQASRRRASLPCVQDIWGCFSLVSNLLAEPPHLLDTWWLVWLLHLYDAWFLHDVSRVGTETWGVICPNKTTINCMCIDSETNSPEFIFLFPAESLFIERSDKLRRTISELWSATSTHHMYVFPLCVSKLWQMKLSLLPSTAMGAQAITN